MLNYFPKYFSNKAIVLYLATITVVSFVFFRQIMYWYWFIFGIVEVVLFFYYTSFLTKKWSHLSQKMFIRKIFTVSIVIRIIWVLISYFFYTAMTGIPFEFSVGDALAYNVQANEIATKGYGALSEIFKGIELGDTGYSTYLGSLYMIFGLDSIIIVRLIKAALGAWTAVLLYKLAVRNFGESTARITAIIFMLMPNFVYYTGLHLKEVEMVFLTVAYLERTDYLIRSKKFNFINFILPFLTASILFTFRTPLGITALFALLTALLFSTEKIFGLGQRFIITLWIMVAVAFFIGSKVTTEVEQLWKERQTNQQGSMQWRSVREGGNKFAEKASTAVFAPAIFIIPVPTMVNVEIQQNQQLLHGGNFDKEILAFFVFIALVWIIKNKKWRDFTLLGAFTIGYLAVIAMSAFAQSERFHQPALPFIVMFASFGITKITNSEKKYYVAYLVALFVVIIGWSWFKLAGRGLV